jgi:hypothetical protein
MNDPLSQQTLRSGPADAQEVYLECGHKFHKDCIEPWIKQGTLSCPLCRAQGGIAQATPQRISQGRQELKRQQVKEGTHRVAKSLVDRFGRYEPRGLDFGEGAAAASASSAPEDVVEDAPLASPELTLEQLRAARLADIEGRRREQQPSENRGGSKQNKYSRKKYSSKKSKIRNYYSISKKHKKYS